jgi:hypothetical protein
MLNEFKLLMPCSDSLLTNDGRLGGLSTGTIDMIKIVVVASALTMSLMSYAVAQDRVTGAPGPAPNTRPPTLHNPFHHTSVHKHKPIHHKSMHKPMAAPMAAPTDAPK